MLNDKPEHLFPKNHRVFEATLRQDLSSFIIHSFRTINPGTAYVHNWHVDAIAEYLAACTRGEIKKLIINLPPRSLKSLCVSVAWPAWLLGNDPSVRIIVGSYSQGISTKHSLDSRLVIQSEWYKKTFPHVQLTKDQNQKAKFQTTRRGYRMATSVGGSVTGEGANFLIIDDPHNPLDLFSKQKRERTIHWYNQIFSTRADNKKSAVHVVVMQRLHEHDLSGFLFKEQEGWEKLELPAIHSKTKTISIGKLEKRCVENELLQPEREDISLLKNLEKTMGLQAFSAQYLQQPLPEKGGLVCYDWLARYKIVPEHTRVIMSWDTAIKAKKENDYSVCTIWTETETQFLLLDVFRKQMEYPELKRTFISLAEKWKPTMILIEDKSSGQSLIQDIRSETKLAVIGIMPHQDKVTRMSMVAGLFESGKTALPHYAPWLLDYEAELLSFPHGEHDDQVDSTSQYLYWSTKKKIITPTIRKV